MTWVLKQKWFWVLAFCLMAVLILPLLIAWIIVSLRPDLMIMAVIAIFVLWWIVRCYKGYSVKKEENRKGL